MLNKLYLEQTPKCRQHFSKLAHLLEKINVGIYVSVRSSVRN